MKKFQNEEIQELQAKTLQIEQDRATKQQLREQKKLLITQQKTQQFREKFVAPVLLILTVLISLLVMLLTKI